MTGYLGCALVLFCFLLLPEPSDGATFADTENLTTTLFANYNPALRPFDHSDFPLYVYMGLWLSSIQDLDEVDQSLIFAATLYVEWVDNRLTWDYTAYNDTTFFTYPQKNLWVPDITIVNTVQTMGEMGFDRNFLYVIDDGTVVWYPGGVFKTSCDIDVTYYPFDTQICQIIFSTLTSSSFEVNMEVDPTYSVYLDKYSPSGTWELIDVQTIYTEDSTTRTKISFEVKLKRLTSYYVVSIIIPILFLSFTATLVFALPADSGEKMGTAITVLLAFAVYLTIVSDQMPKTSLNVPVLALYLSTLLGQTAMAVVLSVWILNLHFRDEQSRPGPGRWTRTLAVFMQRLMCKRPWRNAVEPINNRKSKEIPDPPSTSLELALKAPRPSTAAFGPDKHTEVEEMTWKEVAFTFDRFLFYSFSVFLVTASFIFLTVLAAGGAANS